MRKEYLEAGKVNNTHGLSGEVKFESWGEDLADIGGIKELYLSPSGGEKFTVLRSRRGKNCVLLLLSGTDSVVKAEALKGKVLFAKRSEMDPSGEKVFIAELEGENVTDADTGKVYGKVTGITDKGAGTLFTVLLPDGTEAYLPMKKEFIVSKDPEKGLFVRVPEGMFG